MKSEGREKTIEERGKQNHRIMVLADHDGRKLHKINGELLGKGAELVRQGNALGIGPFSLECLLAGPAGLPAEELCCRGAEKVHYLESSSFRIMEECLHKEPMIRFLIEIRPDVLLIGATEFGRSLAPRIAAALGCGLTADCTDLKLDSDGRLVQIRPAFADNILAHIRSEGLPQMATVRCKEFSQAAYDAQMPVNVVRIPLEPRTSEIFGVEKIRTLAAAEEDITEAEIIVAAGRGIKRKEDLKMMERLADAVGGKLAVSRALVDAGIAKSSRQVGYSGHRVKPRIYIACGISGAPQHLAGMKNARTVIAINSDPSAPIFRVADLGYVGDLYELIPQLIRGLEGLEKGGKTDGDTRNESLKGNCG